MRTKKSIWNSSEKLSNLYDRVELFFATPIIKYDEFSDRLDEKIANKAIDCRLSNKKTLLGIFCVVIYENFILESRYVESYEWIKK